MNVGMLIIGLILLAIGGGCQYAFTRKRETVFQMKVAETRKVGELKELVSEIAGELGSGSFSEALEIKGTLKCAAPLTSELKKEPCAYYEMEVVREYEETIREWDEVNQRESVRTHRGTDTVASNRRHTDFVVDDGTGEIPIRAEGAEIDSVQVLNKFVPGGAGGGGGSAMISYGSFSLSVGDPGANRRTLGYRYTESVLPLERRVYVLGEARDEDGILTVRRPLDSEKRFLISLKSEEELIRAATGSMDKLRYVAYGGFGFGMLCLVLSFVV